MYAHIQSKHTIIKSISGLVTSELIVSNIQVSVYIKSAFSSFFSYNGNLILIQHCPLHIYPFTEIKLYKSTHLGKQQVSLIKDFLWCLCKHTHRFHSTITCTNISIILIILCPILQNHNTYRAVLMLCRYC